MGEQDGPGWRPVSRSRAYELVVDQIEEQILAGTLRVGDRLPGERELAARLEVSRAAVREAIRSLEAQGVVRSGVGSGPDAGTTVSALPSAALTRLLRIHVALANFPVPDVVEARVMLERSSAALAAARVARRTERPAGEGAAGEDPLAEDPLAEDPLAEVRAALDAMEADDLGLDAFNELDTAFHIAIAEAGGNRLVADMTIAIRDSVRPAILRGFEGLGERWPAVRDRLRAEHRGIHEALAAGDADRAADLVDAHIRSASRLLLG